MGPFCPHCGTDLGAAAVDPEDDDEEDDELADDDGPE